MSDWFFTTLVEGGGNDALDVKHISVNEQMHHRLKIIGIGTTNIRGDHHAVPWPVSLAGPPPRP